MVEIQGKFNKAKVFTNNIDDTTISQIITLLNQDFTVDAKIRIMPDTHAGAGCVIGFTADLGDKVIPNIVGVDIGCGMFVINLGKEWINLDTLDNVIHRLVPAGRNIHTEPVAFMDEMDELIQNLRCLPELRNSASFYKSVGTLGGGNHFIELNEDRENGDYYLVIHSGSRNLGKQVADVYQNIAIENCKGLGNLHQMEQDLIAMLKATGRQSLIASELKVMREAFHKAMPAYPKELCFLTLDARADYLHDMEICQRYASLNRQTIADIILMGIFGTDSSVFPRFETIHNYVNFEDNVIRKGAVSAYAEEKLIIPINMRDGSLLCVGKGNADWNFSAPHGAGRLMSRGEAKRHLSVADFQNTMEAAGIYTTTANESTIDESPMAYKPMDEIIGNIGDTVEVKKIIKPVYNFKAGE